MKRFAQKLLAVRHARRSCHRHRHRSEGLAHRPDLLYRARIARQKLQQAALRSRIRPPQHRPRNIPAPMRRMSLGQPVPANRGDRRHAKMNRPWPHLRDQTLRPIKNRMDRSVVHEAADHKIGTFDRLCRRAAGDRTLSRQRRHLFRAPVPNPQRMPCAQQAMRHPRTHMSQT